MIRCIITYVISILLLASGIIFCNPITLYLGAILLFAIFDVFGFDLMLTKVQSDYYKNANISYRLMQGIFQTILFLAVWMFEPLAALSFLWSWWCGVCDWLFYKILNQDYTKFEPIYWTWWTFFGIFAPSYVDKDGIKRKNISAKIFTIFSYIGIITSLIGIVYFHYVKDALPQFLKFLVP